MNIKKQLTTIATVALLAVGGVTAGTADATADTGLVPMAQPSSATGSTVEASAPASGVNFEPSEPAEPGMTAGQRNAVRTAQDYLDYTAFSREGLIEQLEYEDFSAEDATFAVDHITVDWYEQAAKSAQDYLDYSGFSRGGLIDQLVYEGFTPAQAAYGATAAGL